VRRTALALCLLVLLAPAAQARWADEEAFTAPGRQTLVPVAAYDATGRAYVAYTALVTGLVPYWPEAVVRDGAAWSAPVRIGVDTAQVRPARIAAAGDGHAALAILDVTGGGSALSVSRYADGRWTDPVRLSDAGGATAGISLVVTPAGEVHAAWVEGGSRVRAARFASGLWSTADVASVTTAQVTHLALDAAGAPILAWTDAHQTAEGWFVARRSGAGWSAPALAAYPGASDAGSALVLQDAQPLLVWARTLAVGPNPSALVEAARYDGSGWGAVERVAAVPRVGDVDAAALGDGSALAVWVSGPGGIDYDVRAASRSAAGWSAPVQVNASDSAFEASIAARGPLGAVVSWRWRDAPYGAVLADGAWTSAQLAPDGVSGNEPVVAGSASGAALVGWEDSSTASLFATLRRLVNVPGAPAAATATAADGSAEVAWTAPVLTNGAPITSYAVSSVPAGHACTASALARSCTVTGLENGRAYRFRVAAVSAEGTGAAAETGEVTPRSRPAVRVTSTRSAGGVLRTWIEVDRPGTLTQVGRSPAVAPRICRVERTVRAAGRVLLVCVAPQAVRLALPCRPVKVRLVTTFRSADGVQRRAARVARLDACLRAEPVTG
jgi:hypothetical protein